MIFRTPSTSQPSRVALGMRWMVLIVIVVGTIISSIGLTSSHGLAAISVGHTSAQLTADEPHGHSHDDQGDEIAQVEGLLGGDHAHHAVDHSHDKAHALPAGWHAASTQAPAWCRQARPWVEMVQASRLERPPMA
jgi:hypothetical protein